MIEKLNEQQKLQKEVIKNYWINKVLYSGTSIDKKKVEDYMSYIYSRIGKNKPKFVCLSSPLAIQLFINAIQRVKDKKVNNEVRNEVGKEVWDEVQNEVWNEVENEVGNEVWKEVGNEVDNEVRKEVWNEVDKEVWNEVGNEVQNEVGNEVWNEVGKEVRDEVGKEVRNEVGKEVENEVRKEVWYGVGNEVGKEVENEVRKEVRDEVTDEVEKEVRKEVRYEVGKEVWDEVENEVRDEVWNEVRKEVRDGVENEVNKIKNKFYNFAWCDLSNVGWVSFCDFFLKNENIYSEEAKRSFERYLDYLDSGIFMSIATENYFAYCKRPKSVKRNNLKRLHSENSPAIEFDDGYSIYFLNGVSFKKDLFEKVMSGNMSFQEILKIDNTERQLLAMKYNPNALLSEKPTLIKKTERGNELWLIENSEVNKIYDLPKFYLLGYTDPSKIAPNNKMYEPVDPELVAKNSDPDFINASHTKLTLAQYNSPDFCET